MPQLWQGRASKAVDSRVNDFNSSIRFDARMIEQDIQGSLVHSAMLGRQGIISRQDVDDIHKGLHSILDDLHSGATVYESYGAYNMQKRREIITIVDKAEYQKLMSYMNREDPQAFITVYTVSDMRYRPKE